MVHRYGGGGGSGGGAKVGEGATVICTFGD